ncbi:MAG: hypothetical protein IJ678_00140 [Kiritimatiellae bacterium]|nr:hypothetical protein [Kiritimatiellia bacterium]MBR1835967.1 hypothetical protein [Kiritimatiellia bacterium]
MIGRVLDWLGVEMPAEPAAEPAPATPAAPAPAAPARPSAPDNLSGAADDLAAPAWDAATLSSNWRGANAAHRMMNVLSPKMPDATFRDYVAWMKGQGANTAHVFLVNKGDGEYAGYSPWGVGVGPGAGAPNQTTVQTMNGRIDRLRAEGLAVVVWLCADDSADWAAALAKNAAACLRWIADDGLLGSASTVVLGLEMDEYWDSSQAKAVAKATRAVYPGKIGTHHTSGKATFAALGDVLFYQVAPGRTAAQIKADTAAALKHGKPVNFFELDRGPNAALAQAALDAGAFGVGNCAPGVRLPGAAVPAAPASAAAAAPALAWNFGGFDGSRAVEDPATQIRGLSVSSSGMSYKWAAGSLKNWGLADTDASAIAAAFYWDGSRWVGGKFDWISTSRTTRDWKNVRDRYNGWNPDAFFAASRHAFCIVSKDGKKRTNLIEC